MATILRRTVFVDTSDGYYRFHDFARVITTLGVMAEPFPILGARSALGTDLTDLDWTDEMSRIDEIENMPLGREKTHWSGGDHALHGGNCMPRTGR